MMGEAMPALVLKSSDDLRRWYQLQIERGSRDKDSQRDVLRQIRQQVLLQPLPEEDHSNGGQYCTLRGQLWKILLQVETISGDEYASLVSKGRSQVHDKIKNDVFRTFKNDTEFRQRVDENQITRGLNALAHKMVEDKTHTRISYVQGMNVLLAPFLYVMPELDAFYCFHRLLHRHIPSYVDTNCTGVHTALQLFTECLKHCDADLYAKLRTIPVESYAFSPIMSLLAGSPPLSEVLRLWDFMFAFGAHLNVICVLAQVIGLRDAILAEKSPANLLRKLPPLDSHAIITTATLLARELPDGLYLKLTTHARMSHSQPQMRAQIHTEVHARPPQSGQVLYNGAHTQAHSGTAEHGVGSSTDVESLQATRPHVSKTLSQSRIDTPLVDVRTSHSEEHIVQVGDGISQQDMFTQTKGFVHQPLEGDGRTPRGLSVVAVGF
ncbi:hypothetical protein SARC_04253 [Sphaeroforma arctica JP610]|uniref:Rab-GAP TBC domain-containing protein n=1 Tax=Sphaeroforma arctica JP610 TaxID=667725 RepID=A0A0L0G2Y8_9EUKA|nr:hypothetical protein SARC_04253 [Sphaeroforma arctica JP610]KNC83497.1 hypothetical protein SARC_04253 [Sphaeroforma arctica JP610]|eukprot:XP_014157399.1 hypothetical protein SARC_04253 [Sphaeroforma arctica JP610]